MMVSGCEHTKCWNSMPLQSRLCFALGAGCIIQSE